VVVNESVELAKMFGAEQSHKFINGVLDKIARKVRVIEISNAS
jgi:N utilization substance protein B